MKCAACGYEHHVEHRSVDKVVRYTSGKRKGEVKEIKEEQITFTIGHTPFIELKFKKDVDDIIYEDGYGYCAVTLYACPECHTVRFE